MAVMPLSPTKELSNQVDSLDLKEEDTAMTSPPPSVNAHSEDSDHSAAESSKHSPQSSEETAPIPKSEEEKPAEPEVPVPEQIPAIEATEVRPEDIPAPLFVKKSELPTEAILLVHDAPQAAQSVESLDTTMGEAGDSSNSITMGNTDESQQTPAEEVPTAPVVGDFLKMQFVEHKVVPTILVSRNPCPQGQQVTFVGFLLSISVEQFST